MYLEPMGRNLLIEPIKEESMLEMTKETEEKPIKGKILGKGEDCVYDLNIGDVVYFRLFMAHEVEFNGKEYYFIEEMNILGKETNDECNQITNG